MSDGGEYELDIVTISEARAKKARSKELLLVTPLRNGLRESGLSCSCKTVDPQDGAIEWNVEDAG